MSKTRNERKRDLIYQIVASIALIAVCFLLMNILCGMACKAMECPAEQPVTYEEYMERFGGVNA